MTTLTMWALAGCGEQVRPHEGAGAADEGRHKPSLCSGAGDLWWDGSVVEHLEIETDGAPPYHERARVVTYPDSDRTESLDTTWEGDQRVQTVARTEEAGSASVTVTEYVDGNEVHQTQDWQDDGVIDFERTWTWDGDHLLDDLTIGDGWVSHAAYVYDADGLLTAIEYDSGGAVERTVWVTHPTEYVEVRAEDWYYYDDVPDFLERIERLYDADGALASVHRDFDELWTPTQNDGYEYLTYQHGRLVTRDAGDPELGAHQVEAWSYDTWGRELSYTNTEVAWTGEMVRLQRDLAWSCD